MIRPSAATSSLLLRNGRDSGDPIAKSNSDGALRSDSTSLDLLDVYQ